MNWALKLGMLGTRQQTLAPSETAIGNNNYLSQTDFFRMLGAAILLHLIILGIASIWPDEKVTDIPVRALSFKIGENDRIAAFAPQPVQAGAPVAAAVSTGGEWRAAPKSVPPKPEAKEVKPAPQPRIVPIEQPAQRQMPQENPPQPPSPVAPPAPAPQALPSTSILTQQVAVAPSPQRFIREAGSPTGALGGQGAETSLTAETAQEVRDKYELEISGWIQRHKMYPTAANGVEGRAVVRMRIDRSGYVRYYALEESSGSPVLDAAAIDMISRANPMPAVPATYPAGNLIEFLIPIVFRVPT